MRKRFGLATIFCVLLAAFSSLVSAGELQLVDAHIHYSHDAPAAALPLDVTVFSREGCPYCVKAKGLLRDASIEFDELVLNRDFAESTIRAVSGHATVPQMFINGGLIGDSEELEAYLAHADAA